MKFALSLKTETINSKTSKPSIKMNANTINIPHSLSSKDISNIKKINITNSSRNRNINNDIFYLFL